MMKRSILIILVVALMVTTACQQTLFGEFAGNESGMNAITAGVPQETVPAQEPVAAETNESVVPAVKSHFTVTKTEGDLIILAPEAVDPDGDYISYTFSPPFDNQGKWQTHIGDEGDYLVTVTATDTKGASTTETVKVVVLHADRKPTLKCPASIVVREGDVVDLGCTAADPEAENVTLTYSGWIFTPRYTTTYDDAGSYTVTVTAEDTAGNIVSQDVKVTVQDVNRPPVFPADFPQRIEATEGDIVTIGTSGIYDPDGDELTFAFSAPFDTKGVWKTVVGDAGTYPVDVVVSDGKDSVKKQVTVTIGMLNTAPVLKRIPDIRVYEGNTITLQPEATDREGDNLTYDITGWMDTQSYTTTYDDAGSYTVKVTVSDGQFSDSQVVHITVVDRNRPPVFTVPG